MNGNNFTHQFYQQKKKIIYLKTIGQMRKIQQHRQQLAIKADIKSNTAAYPIE